MPYPPDDTITTVLLEMNRVAGEQLSHLMPPVREVPEQHAACKTALTEILADDTSGLGFRAELPVKQALSDAFPGLGGVDLVIEQSGSPLALIELKLGADTLWNSAWDLAKLSLALREGVAQRAFMLGAAPVASWRRERQGPDLFYRRRWATEVFLAQYRNCFNRWATSPNRLPSQMQVEPVDMVPFEVDGTDYEMRLVEVVDDDAGWVRIDESLAAEVLPTGQPPERIPMTDSDEQSSMENCLLAFEGGGVHLLNESDLLINEAAAQSMIPDEDLDAVKLMHFANAADREESIRERGWLDLDPTRAGGPAALRVSVTGQLRDITIELSGRSVVLREHGQISRTASPDSGSWAAFFAEIEEIHPWSWGRWYEPLQWGTDGEGWSVLIAHRGRLACSRGYMVYPTSGGNASTGLDELIDACLRLLDSPANA